MNWWIVFLSSKISRLSFWAYHIFIFLIKFPRKFSLDLLIHTLFLQKDIFYKLGKIREINRL